MYADAEFDGAFKDGKVDLSMGGKLPGNNLDKLMRAQNTVNSYFNNHTYFYGYRHTNQFFGPGRAYNMSPAGLERSLWSAVHLPQRHLRNAHLSSAQHPNRRDSLLRRRQSRCWAGEYHRQRNRP